MKTFDEFLSLYCHLNDIKQDKKVAGALEGKFNALKYMSNRNDEEIFYMIIIAEDIRRHVTNYIENGLDINIKTCASILNWLEKYEIKNIIEDIDIDYKELETIVDEYIKYELNIKFKFPKDSMPILLKSYIRVAEIEKE